MAVAEWAAAHAHSGMSNVSLLIPAMQPINFLNNLTGNQTCPLDYVVGFSRQEIGKVNALSTSSFAGMVNTYGETRYLVLGAILQPAVG